MAIDQNAQNYVYPELQNCVDNFKRWIDNVDTQTDAMIEQVNNLINQGGWTGWTSDDYGKRSQNVKTKLDNSRHQVDALAKAVDEAAIAMQHQDKKGAGTVAGM